MKIVMRKETVAQLMKYAKLQLTSAQTKADADFWIAVLVALEHGD